MRRVYQYSLELNDMASLGDLLGREEQAVVSCNEAMAAATAGLARVAADASVTLQVEHGPGKLDVLANSALLERVLRYVTLMAILSPRVTRVSCEVRHGPPGHKPAIEFRIIDNGRGMTLETRAEMAAGGVIDNNRPAADAAGLPLRGGSPWR